MSLKLVRITVRFSIELPFSSTSQFYVLKTRFLVQSKLYF